MGLQWWPKVLRNRIRDNRRACFQLAAILRTAPVTRRGNLPCTRSTFSTAGIAAPRFVRIGPVHFQPLEWELEPLRTYFGGRMLNAGCGNRDITETLRGFGATEVVNYDIASEIPGARIGPLEKMPFAAAEFDSILCNAVLEHVEAPEPVIREMVRVLRPGGYLVVAIPFLQPFHSCPGDFRRCTREGMRRLGTIAGWK